MSDQGISLREFGRRVDLSGEAIRKAVRNGKIPSDCVGEITLSSGRKRPVIINEQKAAAALEANTSPTAKRNNKKISESVKRRKNNQEPSPGESHTPPLEDPSGSKQPAGPSIAQSQGVREFYRAKLAKVEYETKIGKLVDAEAIQLEMVTMIKAATSKLRGVPTKAKPRIPHLTVDDIEILEDLIDEA